MPADGPIGLTPRTAQRVRKLVADRPAGDAVGPQPAGPRQPKHVKVMGAAAGGWYPCVVSAMASNGTWADDTLKCECVAVDGSTLSAGQRYPATDVGPSAAGTDRLVVTSGGSASCGSAFFMTQFIVPDCDTYGSDRITDSKYRIAPTGCPDPAHTYGVPASGRVTSGGVGVSGVAIQSSTSNPNAGSTVTDTIATTDANGNWSGWGNVVMDISGNPTPTFYVQFTAAGYTPSVSQGKYYEPTQSPLANVNFTA